MSKEKKKKSGTVIDIYPPCEKQEWLKIGVKVCVLGEGLAEFTVDYILKNSVVIHTGCTESFTKIYRPGMLEIDQPRFQEKITKKTR